MLGRTVGSSLTRLPIYARLPLRPAAVQCTLILPHRSYATPGRPRKTVGEPSRPVKRAVKRAAKSTTSDDPASKQVKAKKKTAAAKKKPTKQAAPAKPKRKLLTPEQKEARVARREKDDVKNLKKAALSPPGQKTATAWIMFIKDKLKGVAASGEEGSNQERLRQRIRPVAEQWKALSAAELEHYNHLAHTQTEANQAAYKTWVESHTPEQISLANNARRSLRRKLGDKVKGTSKYKPIKDERLVKRPVTSYLQFSINRQASGDFRNIPVSERSKLISKEWKALSEGEKKKYKDIFSADVNRYSEEYTHVFGHAPPTINGGQQQTAAAAA